MPSIINMKKNISFFDLIVIIFIFAILSSVVWVTYLNAVNTHNAKSAHNNHFTIASIIEGEKYGCLPGIKEWIWSDTVTVICGSTFVDNQIAKFFNNVIKLKNPYDDKKAVYETIERPAVLKVGNSYVILNKGKNSLQVITLTQNEGKLLHTEKSFK